MVIKEFEKNDKIERVEESGGVIDKKSTLLMYSTGDKD